jgi:two-component system, NtrC family, sensor kinase
MNQHLQNILSILQQSEQLPAEQKAAVEKAVKEAGKELDIALFKLDRTEKVKRTTAILLEETIEELEQKRKSIEETNVALQQSLEDLKAAQAQLVQSEKMASLGELTAGIAHEIQNPLNFVNNFSELSNELIEELKVERGKLKEERDDQLEEDLLNDIAGNLEKINHHGKRADAIVKGMLQHSSSSTGAKEPTDINKLIGEYVRLCYHGLRAKDKSFSVIIKTDFDEAIQTVSVVPQDIGRAVLNLLTNAFYAVNERKKQEETGFEPTVSIRTTKIGHAVELSVTDNGNGIPLKLLDKIFQPFFTTKPTGQGTGLGLSLTYDIISKGHGGTLKADTAEGEGTTFIIQLPY